MIKNKKIIMLIMILLTSIIAGGIYYYNSQRISLSNNKNNDVIETIDSDENNYTNETENKEVGNYDTANINEFINNDEIVSMGIFAARKQFSTFDDKNQIVEVARYLKSLTVKKVNQRPSSDTPEDSISFTDRTGKVYSIDFYDGTTSIIRVDNELIGDDNEFYNFIGFDAEELRSICEKSGLIGK